MSDSAMDDLWRALSGDVIGRHVGFLCENESMRKVEISKDSYGPHPNSSNQSVR